MLESGTEEALNAAEAIGTLIVSSSRARAGLCRTASLTGRQNNVTPGFKRGFDSGDPAQCNTFGKAM